MAKKNKSSRADLSQDVQSFCNHPFASLQNQRIDLPKGPPPSPEHRPPSAPYHVQRTRKGGWPLRLEKRGGGKVVTVLERVSGDSQVLLKQLKKHCGSGGSLHEDTVLMQGDQRARIEQFLDAQRGGPHRITGV